MQINDFNPGIASDGLFWTTGIPNGSVHVDLHEGEAVMHVANASVIDYHDFLNALFGGGPAPVPAVVSFTVKWSGVDERVTIVNQAQGFEGRFVRNRAQMEWSAKVGDFKFVSEPLRTSESVFAQIGFERNGEFFRG